MPQTQQKPPHPAGARIAPEIELPILGMIHVAAAILTLATETRMGAMGQNTPPDPNLSGANDVPLTTEVDNFHKVWVFFLVSTLSSPDWPTLTALLTPAAPAAPVTTPPTTTAPAAPTTAPATSAAPPATASPLAGVLSAPLLAMLQGMLPAAGS